MTCNNPRVSSDRCRVQGQCVPPVPASPAPADLRSHGSVLFMPLRMTHIEPVVDFERMPIHRLLVDDLGGRIW